MFIKSVISIAAIATIATSYGACPANFKYSTLRELIDEPKATIDGKDFEFANETGKENNYGGKLISDKKKLAELIPNTETTKGFYGNRVTTSIGDTKGKVCFYSVATPPKPSVMPKSISGKVIDNVVFAIKPVEAPNL